MNYIAHTYREFMADVDYEGKDQAVNQHSSIIAVEHQDDLAVIVRQQIEMFMAGVGSHRDDDAMAAIIYDILSIDAIPALNAANPEIKSECDYYITWGDEISKRMAPANKTIPELSKEYLSELEEFVTLIAVVV